jgi:hypothetical protein
MNMKTFPLGVLVLTIALFTALSLTGCDNGNDNNGNNNPGNPTPHQTTITAFGRTITVTGDAALSTADFNTAKGKLEQAMTLSDTNTVNAPAMRKEYTDMLDRTDFAIIIKTGNASPNADANKSLTIGVDYLLLTSNDADAIGLAIYNKVVVDRAFADPATPAVPNPATITQGTPKGLAFAGSVTIKSNDTYTPAEWDAVVQKVIAALNRGYNKFTTVGGLDDVLNKNKFENAFSPTDVNAEIIISSSASKKIEVLSTDYEKMYLKASAINDTLDLCPAITAMSEMDGGYELANAAPPKHRAFLALERGGVPGVEIA